MTTAAPLAVSIRAYGPLNDFLPACRRHVAWTHLVDRRAAVKDVLEGAGIPHPEIDLILVNGASVPFDHAVEPGDRIAVFPRFMALDIDPTTRVRVPTPALVRFVADVHLGALARRLRLVGLDTAYDAGAGDAELAARAGRDDRILLTRDRALLKRRVVAHGYFVRETNAHRQLVEVLRRFGPLELHPFSRCLRCNGELREVPKSSVDAALLPRTREYYDRFHLCAGCGRIYWQGSHWQRLARAVDAVARELE